MKEPLKYFCKNILCDLRHNLKEAYDGGFCTAFSQSTREEFS